MKEGTPGIGTIVFFNVFSCILLVFLTFSVSKIDDKIESLKEEVNKMQIETAELKEVLSDLVPVDTTIYEIISITDTISDPIISGVVGDEGGQKITIHLKATNSRKIDVTRDFFYPYKNGLSTIPELSVGELVTIPYLLDPK